MMSTSSLALLALGLGEILQRMGVLSVILSKMEIFIRESKVVGADDSCDLFGHNRVDS